jgi:hypothetical protein
MRDRLKGPASVRRMPVPTGFDPGRAVTRGSTPARARGFQVAKRGDGELGSLQLRVAANEECSLRGDLPPIPG